MSKIIGRLVQLGIHAEVERGTAVGTPAYMVAWSELDLDEMDSRVVDEQAIGKIEGSVGESIVKQWVEGAIKAPIVDQSFPLLLYSLFGTLDSVTGTAAGTPYYHTFTVAQSSQHQSLTLLLDDPSSQDYTYAGAVVNQIEVSYEREKFLGYSAGVRSKKGSAVSVTAGTASGARFLPQHLTFTYADTRAGLGTGTTIALKSATLRINQNIEDDDVLGNIAPVDFLTKQFEVEGEVEAIFQNESDLKTFSLTGSAKAVRFIATNTDEVIDSTGTNPGTINPEVRIDLHKVQFQPITKPLRLNDIIMQRMSFRAHYDTADARMITIDVVNSESSYAA